MTDFPISVTNARMGRPALKAKVKTEAVLIRLPADILSAVDELAGPNKRGEFVREAVDREIKRREREAKAKS